MRAPTLTRILAVDDCPVQRVMLTVYLEAAGYLVVAVESGREALEAARSGRFDVVVLDVNMPDMDGPQIGRALRADPATRGLPIIMRTTESEATVRERFDGFDGFLAKPSTAAQLNERITALLDERRSRRGLLGLAKWASRWPAAKASKVAGLRHPS